MKRKSLKLKYYSYLLVLFCFCGNLLHGQSQYELKTVKQKADSIFAACEGQPGCAVSVMHKKESIYKAGYGYANLDYSTPTNKETVFEIGSLSMHVTAAAIMLLVDEGKLSLDDDIREYLPELPDYKEGTITVRHLLTHTSGLRDYIVLIIAGGRTLDIDFSNDDALALLSKQESLCMAPGSSLRFSFSNYTALSIIIERISNGTYADYLAENLFTPAGMNSTEIYQNPQKVIKNRAISYEGEAPDYQKILWEKFTANGSLHVLTTINDFVKWNKFLKEKEVGGQTLLEKLGTTTRLNTGQLLTYRFGLEGGTFLGHEMLAHNGYSFGYSAMYLNFPDEDLAIISMSSNMNHSGPVMAYDLAGAILPEKEATTNLTAEIKPKEPIRLRKKLLEKFSGDYFDSKFAYTRKIYVKEDTLRLEINPNAVRTLVPLSKNEFIISGSPNVSIIFEEQESTTQMSVAIDGGEPAIYNSYTPANYIDENLRQFQGEFFSQELNVTYRIDLEGTTLSTYVGERRLVDYSGIMEDNFTSEHDGYITFLRDQKGKITSFILSDYSLGSITFIKS